MIRVSNSKSITVGFVRPQRERGFIKLNYE